MAAIPANIGAGKFNKSAKNKANTIATPVLTIRAPNFIRVLFPFVIQLLATLQQRGHKVNYHLDSCEKALSTASRDTRISSSV
jgi:hypothetical protein